MISATPSESDRLDRLLVHLLAEDQHHDVGVLFERAGFAQVRQLRPLVGARFRRARQLRQHDDRHVQLLGEPLQRARDRRQLERAVLEPAAAGHQLDVVDGQHAQAVLGLQPPRLGAHLEHADARRVVDEQLRLAQRLQGVRDLAVLLLADLAAHQPVVVDLRLRASMRMNSCSFDISRLKKPATPPWWRRAGRC